jgi:hypothetical protein
MADAVTIYLKYPSGLTLRLHQKQVVNETAPGGVVLKSQIAVPHGDHVVLNGTAAPFGQARKDKDGNFVQVIGGYAVTSNVPKDFWDRWIAENKDLDLVRNGLIYAHEKPAEGEAWSKDHASTRTGLEPLTPTVSDAGGRVMQTDSRAPRGVALADRAAA